MALRLSTLCAIIDEAVLNLQVRHFSSNFLPRGFEAASTPSSPRHHQPEDFYHPDAAHPSPHHFLMIPACELNIRDVA
ncbi:uncharacterized protein EI90DRAFT_3030765 [Cantharellus anzutake]|uniref:uncharacterized protein n=1 Tax=Cantharellus anzutake TaxID=1750568 RepID=UPI00190692B7|nr:uncharacterized protein EI90DRAFT_3030765 [Cantharellus anzutake]KAF8342935.1 hypothetical protein EI90DRAFT_3030765 [Cantharellus anzutake]